MKALSVAPLLFLFLCTGAMAQQDAAAEAALPKVMDIPPQVERPEDRTSGASANPKEPALPADAPVPMSRKPAAQPIAEEEPSPPPAEEIACRTRLRSMGVAFEEAPPISEPEGCAAAHPLTVTRLTGGVELQPPAVLTCAMAEATAGFVRNHAAPAVREEFDVDLGSIRQVSSYVCRPRNGSAKLSEHAFANALDWGTLVLEDGQTIDLRAHGRSEPRRTRLIETIRQAACGPFKTVLGPGSDADHADYFHFDMAQRRNGGTFCQ